MPSATWWLKIEPSAAMPMAMPTWRKVELTPEAIPERSGRDHADRRRGERHVDQADADAGHDQAGDQVRPLGRVGAGGDAAHQEQAERR